MTGVPMRIQRRRLKGWRMPEGAIAVTRPGPWGNPFNFKPSEYCWLALSYGSRGDLRGRQEASVKAYRDWLDAPDGYVSAEYERGVTFGDVATTIDIGPRVKLVRQAPSRAAIVSALRGHDLACWCGLCPQHTAGLPLDVTCTACSPCHADVLLELANQHPTAEME